MGRSKYYPQSAVGTRYGRLEIVDFMHLQGKVQKRWVALCKCDCGTEKWIDWANILSGAQVSCGCYRLERFHETIRKRNAARRIEIMDVVDAHPEWTLQEIGDEFGFTREYIRQIIKRERGDEGAKRRATVRRELGKGMMDEIEHLRAIVAGQKEAQP